MAGPGCIRHFYCVGSRGGHSGDLSNRNRAFIIRFYWDGEEQPSVEVPLADLFGVHHNVSYYPINSFYVTAKADAGFGCYFPMPFARSARVEVEALEDGTFIYTLDWHRYLDGGLEEPLRFHASWRRENPAPAWGEDFLVMDALGSGYLAGFSLGVRLRSDEQRWSHAGSENLYLDGEATGEEGVVPHYLRAGGGENTFDAGFGGVTHAPDTGLYSGIPYLEYRDAGPALARHVLSAYRFYVHDLLPFHRSLHFRWGSHCNDMCATAYWYQTEPHRPFVRMASAGASALRRLGERGRGPARHLRPAAAGRGIRGGRRAGERGRRHLVAPPRRPGAASAAGVDRLPASSRAHATASSTSRTCSTCAAPAPTRRGPATPPPWGA